MSTLLTYFQIHRLAVSLLTSQQLLEYNAYATKKKNRARIREHLALYRSLSTPAKKALRYLTRVDSSEQLKVMISLPILLKLRKVLQHLAIYKKKPIRINFLKVFIIFLICKITTKSVTSLRWFF